MGVRNLQEHQSRLTENRGAPSAQPVNTPGVQIDPPKVDDTPWWMYMGEGGLKASQFASASLGTLVGVSAVESGEEYHPDQQNESRVCVEDEVQYPTGGRRHSRHLRRLAEEEAGCIPPWQ